MAAKTSTRKTTTPKPATEEAPAPVEEPQPTKPKAAPKVVPTDQDREALTLVSAAQTAPTKRHTDGCSYLVKKDGTAAATRPATEEEMAALTVCTERALRVARARIAAA